jgi:hypothetical protein
LSQNPTGLLTAGKPPAPVFLTFPMSELLRSEMTETEPFRPAPVRRKTAGRSRGAAKKQIKKKDRSVFENRTRPSWRVAVSFGHETAGV